MRLIIRKATINEASDFWQLNKEFHGENAATIVSIKDSLTHNNKEIVMIAYYNGKPAGFVCGEISKSVCYMSDHGSIGELFVSGEYRRKGIGRLLIRSIEDIFKETGIKIVTLGTNVKNITAQKFYEECRYLKKDRIEYRKYL